MIWHESCRIILNGVKSRWHWLHFLLVAIIAVTLELTIGSNPERLDLGSRYSCAWILKIQTDIYIWFMVIWTHDRSFWFVGICQLFQYSTCMCKRDQTVWMIFISIIIYMSMYTYIFETLEHLIFLISRNWPMTFQYILNRQLLQFIRGHALAIALGVSVFISETLKLTVLKAAAWRAFNVRFEPV